jgi:hypothetical protein
MIKLLNHPSIDPPYFYGIEMPVNWGDQKRICSLFDVEHWLNENNISYVKHYRRYWFTTQEDRLLCFLTFS